MVAGRGDPAGWSWARRPTRPTSSEIVPPSTVEALGIEDQIAVLASDAGRADRTSGPKCLTAIELESLGSYRPPMSTREPVSMRRGSRRACHT
jgi:hypothetical protein